MPPKKAPAQPKAGLHGFGSNGRVGPIKAPVKPKKPKKGASSWGQLLAEAHDSREARKNRRKSSTTARQEEEETEAADVKEMEEQVVLSEDESENGDGGTKEGEEGDFEEEEDAQGNINKKTTTESQRLSAEDKEKQLATKHDFKKRLTRCKTRIEQVADRCGDDATTPYDIREEDIDPRTLLPPDKGGYHVIELHREGTIYEDPEHPGTFIDASWKGKNSVEKFRLSRSQPCPHSCGASMPRNSDQCPGCGRSAVPLVTGTFIVSIEKRWTCDFCSRRNKAGAYECDCGVSRPWKCGACNSTTNENVRCASCNRGIRPLSEEEIYNAHINPPRPLRVRRIANESLDEDEIEDENGEVGDENGGQEEE